MIQKRVAQQNLSLRHPVDLKDGKGRGWVNIVIRYISGPQYSIAGGSSIKNRSLKPSFYLRREPDGKVYTQPKIGSATSVKTEQQAVDLFEEWLAQGAPGVVLEDYRVTRAKAHRAVSARNVPVIRKKLKTLVAEDLRTIITEAEALLAAMPANPSS